MKTTKLAREFRLIQRLVISWLDFRINWWQVIICRICWRWWVDIVCLREVILKYTLVDISMIWGWFITELRCIVSRIQNQLWRCHLLCQKNHWVSSIQTFLFHFFVQRQGANECIQLKNDYTYRKKQEIFLDVPCHIVKNEERMEK